jgi:hypothetical protein
MRRTKTTGLAVLVLAVSAAGAASAGPLNPLDFPLSGSGAFPTAAGTYLFDTSGPTPILHGPGGTSIPGLVFSDAPGHQVAVFDFTDITVGSDQSFASLVPSPPVFSSLALVLLSRGGITVNGTIDVSAPSQGFSPGGPGGFGHSGGPGAGGGGFFDRGNGDNSSAGGGGFGGAGGNGRLVTGTGQVFPFGGGSGGRSYGDLAVSLQGGSGGGDYGSGSSVLGGGGGGGAIELGAIGGITVAGSILANGGFPQVSSGGGAGGGIFLHGDSVSLLSSSALSAKGGDSGLGFLPGGGGGGGRVLIEVGSGGFTGDVGRINVSGGLGNMNGAPGVFAIVPEPGSWVLLGVGLLGVLGSARHAGRRSWPRARRRR